MFRGIEFIGPFLSSLGMKYVFVVVDFISKLVEAIALPKNEGKSVTALFIKNIFCIPRAIIRDVGTQFFDNLFKGLLEKYWVLHNVATPYHPQTSEHVEVSNQDINQIIAKLVNNNRIY